MVVALASLVIVSKTRRMCVQISVYINVCLKRSTPEMPAQELDSVAILLMNVRAGDDLAIRDLWNEIYPKVVALAKAQLSPRESRMQDEDDAAAVVLGSLIKGLIDGRFKSLDNRRALWALVSVMTRRTAGKIRRAAYRDPTRNDTRGMDSLSCSRTRDPSPAELSIGNDFVITFLAHIGERHRSVVRLRLEGYTVKEIAAELGITTRSVFRRLREVREQCDLRGNPFSEALANIDSARGKTWDRHGT